MRVMVNVWEPDLKHCCMQTHCRCGSAGTEHTLHYTQGAGHATTPNSTVDTQDDTTLGGYRSKMQHTLHKLSTHKQYWRRLSVAFSTSQRLTEDNQRAEAKVWDRTLSDTADGMRVRPQTPHHPLHTPTNTVDTLPTNTGNTTTLHPSLQHIISTGGGAVAPLPPKSHQTAAAHLQSAAPAAAAAALHALPPLPLGCCYYCHCFCPGSYSCLHSMAQHSTAQDRTAHGALRMRVPCGSTVLLFCVCCCTYLQVVICGWHVILQAAVSVHAQQRLLRCHLIMSCMLHSLVLDDCCCNNQLTPPQPSASPPPTIACTTRTQIYCQHPTWSYKHSRPQLLSTGHRTRTPPPHTHTQSHPSLQDEHNVGAIQGSCDAG